MTFINLNLEICVSILNTTYYIYIYWLESFKFINQISPDLNYPFIAFYTHIPYCAHFGQLIHSLEPMVDRLREEGGKLLVVEDLEAAAGGNLANCCRMKTKKTRYL